jgi:ketosteroid isomerase-like protein
MKNTVPCPSDLALEQYVLGELGASHSLVADHVAICEICRAAIADKAAHSAAFASSPGAQEIRRSLRASTPVAESPSGPRRRRFAALGFAAAIAMALVLTLRPRSQGTSAPALGPPPSAAQQTQDEEVVLRVQREWMEAVRDKDVAALDRILADDYTYTDSRGRVSNKADNLRQARAASGRMKAFHTFDAKARVYGDLAIVTGRMRVEGTASGQPYDAEVRFTDILARIDGRWRAVAAHASNPGDVE